MQHRARKARHALANLREAGRERPIEEHRGRHDLRDIKARRQIPDEHIDDAGRGLDLPREIPGGRTHHHLPADRGRRRRRLLHLNGRGRARRRRPHPQRRKAGGSRRTGPGRRCERRIKTVDCEERTLDRE